MPDHDVIRIITLKQWRHIFHVGSQAVDILTGEAAEGQRLQFMVEADDEPLTAEQMSGISRWWSRSGGDSRIVFITPLEPQENI